MPPPFDRPLHTSAIGKDEIRECPFLSEWPSRHKPHVAGNEHGGRITFPEGLQRRSLVIERISAHLATLRHRPIDLPVDAQLAVASRQLTYRAGKRSGQSIDVVRSQRESRGARVAAPLNQQARVRREGGQYVACAGASRRAARYRLSGSPADDHCRALIERGVMAGRRADQTEVPAVARREDYWPGGGSLCPQAARRFRVPAIRLAAGAPSSDPGAAPPALWPSHVWSPAAARHREPRRRDARMH